MYSAVKELARRYFGRSDSGRWSDLSNHDPVWDERTKQIGALVPKGSHVIEFGAGRRQLENYLDRSCFYIPSDLVSRGPDTIVHDLNVRPHPDLAALNLDVAVFGGVLEYVRDLQSVVHWIAQFVDVLIVSYEYALTSPRTIGRAMEAIRRARMGWINSYTESDFVGLLETEGFALQGKVEFEEPDGVGHIFLFRKIKS